MAAKARSRSREVVRRDAKLVVLTGATSQEIRVTGPHFTIGRGGTCDLVVRNKFVSKEHARLERQGGGYVLSDLASRNGVFVNEDRILGPYRLRDGDLIQIGDVKMTFHAESPPRGVPDETETFASPLIPSAGKARTIEIDEGRREVWVEGRALARPLSRQEFQFLILLWDAAGRIRSREELGDAIWGAGCYDLNMLHRLAHRLKRKLAEGSGEEDSVISVPGVGYKLKF